MTGDLSPGDAALADCKNRFRVSSPTYRNRSGVRLKNSARAVAGEFSPGDVTLMDCKNRFRVSSPTYRNRSGVRLKTGSRAVTGGFSLGDTALANCKNKFGVSSPTRGNGSDVRLEVRLRAAALPVNFETRSRMTRKAPAKNHAGALCVLATVWLVRIGKATLMNCKNRFRVSSLARGDGSDVRLESSRSRGGWGVFAGRCRVNGL